MKYCCSSQPDPQMLCNPMMGVEMRSFSGRGCVSREEWTNWRSHGNAWLLGAPSRYGCGSSDGNVPLFDDLLSLQLQRCCYADSSGQLVETGSGKPYQGISPTDQNLLTRCQNAGIPSYFYSRRLQPQAMVKRVVVQQSKSFSLFFVTTLSV